jgi:hypothetical protein
MVRARVIGRRGRQNRLGPRGGVASPGSWDGSSASYCVPLSRYRLVYAVLCPKPRARLRFCVPSLPTRPAVVSDLLRFALHSPSTSPLPACLPPLSPCYPPSPLPARRSCALLPSEKPAPHARYTSPAAPSLCAPSLRGPPAMTSFFGRLKSGNVSPRASARNCSY